MSKINEESLACVAQYQTKEYLDIEKICLLKKNWKRRSYTNYI